MVCCCNCPTVDQCLSPLVAAGKMDGRTGKTNDIRLLGGFLLSLRKRVQADESRERLFLGGLNQIKAGLGHKAALGVFQRTARDALHLFKKTGTNKAVGMRYGDANRKIAGLWWRESLPGTQEGDVVGGGFLKGRDTGLWRVISSRCDEVRGCCSPEKKKKLMQADARG